MTLREGVTVLLIPRRRGRVALLRAAKGRSYMISQFVHMPSLLVNCVNIPLMTWIHHRHQISIKIISGGRRELTMWRKDR